MRQIWIGSILLSTALGSPAATLGRHSGAVVIGRPLDIKVQASAGSDEDLAGQCVHADVLFGDNQVGPSSVRTSVQRNAPDAEASVRIQTTVPVNEPIVSVVVRAGCLSPFSRRYVLLADLLSEPATTAGAVSETGSVASANPAELRALPPLKAAPSLRSGRSSGAGAGAEPSAAAAGGPKPGTLANAIPQRTKPPSVVRRDDPPKDAGPRLHLDPVDVNLGIERDPALRLSLALLSEPTSNEQERAAAAQLWKALNASPEDILRDAQKLSVLEAESKGLREQEAKNKAALQALEAEVEKSRYMTWLAYLLGGLLLLSLLGVSWLWKRRSAAGTGDAKAKSWWAAGSSKNAAATAKGAVKPSRPLDLDLDLGDESGLDDLHVLHSDASESEAALLTAADRREFPASQMGVSRSVATEELFDVQQQSDFFVSLGEFDQAIGVLKNHINESHEPSALAYLDLFKLYHKLDRRSDYDRLRVEFNQKFNAGAPPFDQYSDASQGLESYETAFGRIQALWPQPRVLDVIENSIFRDASDGEAEVFDLEAYRELLLLHAIAKDVIKRDAGLGASDFQHTSIRPLKAAGPRGAVAAGAAAAVAGASGDRNTQPLEDIPHASPRLGLDVDLDALQEASAFEASLPEVAVPVEQTAKVVSPLHAGDELSIGNLIDFEVLDFMPPDDDADKGGKAG
ncbi:type IV pilus assembly protein FimV [Hydrogenophaga sp. MI9]|uniref:type IV pilus assembly protein FimV n=1 Tax=Hydrogenophaga sp. MI9 TaxID=3453719 RepID=UPI003EE8A1FA